MLERAIHAGAFRHWSIYISSDAVNRTSPFILTNAERAANAVVRYQLNHGARNGGFTEWVNKLRCVSVESN